MRDTIKIYSVPLWPLVKNVFIISLIVFTLMSLVFGLFWVGFMRQFATTFSGTGTPVPMGTFQNLGGLFVIMFSIFYGIFASVVFTLLTGLAGLLYNWMNRRTGGLEFEISLPDSFTYQTTDRQVGDSENPVTRKELTDMNNLTESDPADDDTR